MKWFFRGLEDKKRNDEIARSLLAIDQLTPYWLDYKKVFATHVEDEGEKAKIALFLFYLGVLDQAMQMFQVRYEIFLDRVYERFADEGLNEIITEIFIEFHINRESSISAEKTYIEGKISIRYGMNSVIRVSTTGKMLL